MTKFLKEKTLEAKIPPQVVPMELAGLRVDAILAKLYPQHSRSRLTSWLKQGFITVDSHTYKPKEKLFGGEVLAWQGESLAPPKLEAQKLAVQSQDENVGTPPATPKKTVLDPFANLKAQELPLAIVHEEEGFLLVNKAAGMVVHPGAGTRDGTLVNGLLYHAPQLAELPRAGIIHRLDKETTGLLIVAKTHEMHTYFVRQLQEHLIQRQYAALVYGHLISGGEVHTFYGRDPRNRLKMKVLAQSSREAITHYRINKQYGAFTLLDVELLTGRTHQIRVHMAHLRHPVVGDPLYGGRKRFPAKISAELRSYLEAFQRQALHAQYLSFTHPETEALLRFTAPLPEDFLALLTLLEQEYDTARN